MVPKLSYEEIKRDAFINCLRELTLEIEEI